MGFTLKHYIRSYAYPTINNKPGIDVGEDALLTENYIVNNIKNLHTNCIQPIVDLMGEGNLIITSGYRCKELNEKIGGVSNSHHTLGAAADIVSIGYPSATLFNLIYQNVSSFNQLIWEYPERGNYSQYRSNYSWISISYLEGNNPRTVSMASERDDLHEMYETEDTCRIGNYTHGISFAENNLV